MKVLFILGLCLIALSRKIKIKKSLHGKWNYIDWKKVLKNLKYYYSVIMRFMTLLKYLR